RQCRIARQGEAAARPCGGDRISLHQHRRQRRRPRQRRETGDADAGAEIGEDAGRVRGHGGGEQQRVNIARSFVDPTPVMLLDEPTASLDAGNREVVVDLIREVRDAGAAIVGIFHDEDVRERVASRFVDLLSLKAA
ncbi:ATP-binding cassette domain-containing protein, partial [Mycobacterium tuberculosis]|nr:ATP-binding cassette domain-containing protein [Mycobacterium tuberculosis]